MRVLVQALDKVSGIHLKSIVAFFRPILYYARGLFSLPLPRSSPNDARQTLNFKPLRELPR